MRMESFNHSFIYDNEDILLELDGSNNITARYTHGPGIDEPLIMEKAGASFFYHADGLGSITDITDSTGAVKQSYTYSSFGKIESQLDAKFSQPYTFTGREFDPETDTYHYRHRTYDWRTGRFTTEDPVRFDGGINFYAYVDNNPVNRVDPSGLKSSCVCGGFSACAAIGVGLCGGTAKCRCTEECGKAEWLTVNYICACIPGLGFAIGAGPSFGGGKPQRGVVEGAALSIPVLRRRNIGVGTSPGPGQISIDIGPGVFAGYCACAIDVVK